MLRFLDDLFDLFVSSREWDLCFARSIVTDVPFGLFTAYNPFHILFVIAHSEVRFGCASKQGGEG